MIAFQHIPKTGGSSISTYLLQFIPSREFIYSHVYPLKSEECNNNYSFTVVRDPVSRFVSAFNWIYAGGESEYDRLCREILQSKYGLDIHCLLKDPSFIYGFMQKNFFHFKPMNWFIANNQFKKIFHYEDGVENICAVVLKENNIKKTDVKLLRLRSVSNRYTIESISTEEKAVLKTIYSADYERFKYQ